MSEQDNKSKPVGQPSTGKETAKQGTDHLENKEEKNKKEKLTMDDLKGKKVDAFPDTQEDKPLTQKEKK